MSMNDFLVLCFFVGFFMFGVSFSCIYINREEGRESTYSIVFLSFGLTLYFISAMFCQLYMDAGECTYPVPVTRGWFYEDF